jgi:hypothetical protein
MVNVRAGKLCLLLAVCVYLNLLDLLATLSWCQNWGWLMEMNPVMRYFFTIDPLLGGAVKMTTVLLFVVVMQYGSREHFSTVYRGTMLVTMVYSALLGWHLIGPWLHS